MRLRRKVCHCLAYSDRDPVASTPPRPLAAIRAPERLAYGAGDLEVLADEDVVRPTDLDHVDCVRAVAQLQHAVDGAARVLGERGGFGRVRRRPGDDRSGPGMPVLRHLTDGSLVLARLRQP